MKNKAVIYMYTGDLVHGYRRMCGAYWEEEGFLETRETATVGL